MIVSNHHAGRLSFSEDVEARSARCGDSLHRGRNAACVTTTASIFLPSGTSLRLIGRELNGPKIVVLKSTVPVETSEMVASDRSQRTPFERHRVDVVSNPEFLREGSAVADFMHPRPHRDRHEQPASRGDHARLYAPLDAPFVVTDGRTSEMIKYAANAFLATKVSFMNEIANICELVDVDVKAVGSGIGYDHRIGSSLHEPRHRVRRFVLSERRAGT